MTLIDLTHSFTSDMPVYPGDPCAKLYQTMTINEDGVADEILETGMHVGTHMDAPFHMVEGGARISEIPLRHFKGRGVLIDARGQTEIGADLIENSDIQAGDIVLIYTDWDQHFRDESYFDDYPCISESLARLFVEAKINLVAMDTPSPDREPFPVHKILLGNDIMIVENATNLGALHKAQNFTVYAYPAKFHASGAPVRLVAEVYE